MLKVENLINKEIYEIAPDIKCQEQLKGTVSIDKKLLSKKNNNINSLIKQIQEEYESISACVKVNTCTLADVEIAN